MITLHKSGTHGATAYRPDVDGLRAVAVLCVVLYHGFPTMLPGGFVGVDVFFVISGFLITGIILDDIEGGAFTFRNFYARRVRRIFPALIVVMAASLLAGAVLLLPEEFAQLGRHAASGAMFVSNLTLYREVDYFDTAAEFKPLLHLWSLAVEEQYYLVWPVLLYAMRRRLRWGWLLIGAIALASFALNVAFVEHRPSATFYLPFTRFWELMVGGAVVYGQRLWIVRAAQPMNPPPTSRMGRVLQRVRMAASVAGAALLALAVTTINADRAFPGWWALLPTLGTAMLLVAGPQAWINRHVLSTRWLVLVGLISYPLYLWHWPLLAFARIRSGSLPWAGTLTLIFASLVLAWLTYRFVEIRFRARRPQAHRRRAAQAALAGMSLVALVGLLSAVAILPPMSGSSAFARQVEAAASDWFSIVELRVPGQSSRTVLFFGDSHMQQYGPRFVENERFPATLPVSLEFMTRGGCAPMPGIERRGLGCASFVQRGFERAGMPDIDTIVIAASWYGFVTRDDVRRTGQTDGPPLRLMSAENDWVFDGFEKALDSLVHQGKKVIIVLSSPRGDVLNPRRWVERSMTGISRRELPPLRTIDFKSMVAPVDDKIASIALRVGATLIDPSRALCNAVCAAVDADGHFIFKDDTHLRASFMRSSFDMLDSVVLGDRLDLGADAPAPLRRPSAAPVVTGRQLKDGS